MVKTAAMAATITPPDFAALNAVANSTAGVCDATGLKPSFSRTGDSWLIADMYLDGVISELATRRS